MALPGTNFTIQIQLPTNSDDKTWSSRAYRVEGLEWSLDVKYVNGDLRGYLQCMKNNQHLYWRGRATWHFEVSTVDGKTIFQTESMTKDFFQRAIMVPLLGYEVKIASKRKLKEPMDVDRFTVSCIVKNAQNQTGSPPPLPTAVYTFDTLLDVDAVCSSRRFGVDAEESFNVGGHEVTIHVNYLFFKGMLCVKMRLLKKGDNDSFRFRIRKSFAVIARDAAVFVSDSDEAYGDASGTSSIDIPDTAIAMKRLVLGCRDANGNVLVRCLIEDLQVYSGTTSCSDTESVELIGNSLSDDDLETISTLSSRCSSFSLDDQPTSSCGSDFEIIS